MPDSEAGILMHPSLLQPEDEEEEMEEEEMEEEEEEEEVMREEPRLDQILNGVVAFIDVRTANASMCAGLARKVEEMGGQVAPSFTQKVTHVVCVCVLSLIHI